MASVALPGGGLWSTADDLVRFGRAFLREGELDGARVLSPAWVRLMTTETTVDGIGRADDPTAVEPLRPRLGQAGREDAARLGSGRSATAATRGRCSGSIPRSTSSSSTCRGPGASRPAGGRGARTPSTAPCADGAGAGGARCRAAEATSTPPGVRCGRGAPTPRRTARRRRRGAAGPRAGRARAPDPAACRGRQVGRRPATRPGLEDALRSLDEPAARAPCPGPRPPPAAPQPRRGGRARRATCGAGSGTPGPAGVRRLVRGDLRSPAVQGHTEDEIETVVSAIRVLAGPHRAPDRGPAPAPCSWRLRRVVSPLERLDGPARPGRRGATSGAGCWPRSRTCGAPPTSAWHARRRSSEVRAAMVFFDATLFTATPRLYRALDAALDAGAAGRVPARRSRRSPRMPGAPGPGRRESRPSCAGAAGSVATGTATPP